MNTKRHKHANLIHAWAEGAEKWKSYYERLEKTDSARAQGDVK